MESLMRFFSRFTIEQIILFTVLIALSVPNATRSLVLGLGFIDVADSFSPNGTYALLDNLLDLKVWGSLFLINVAVYIIGIFFFFKKQWLSILMFAGVMGGTLMFFYVAASWENSTTKIHTHGYIITCSLNYFIALLGGATHWLRTKARDM